MTIDELKGYQGDGFTIDDVEMLDKAQTAARDWYIPVDSKLITIWGNSDKHGKFYSKQLVPNFLIADPDFDIGAWLLEEVERLVIAGPPLDTIQNT